MKLIIILLFFIFVCIVYNKINGNLINTKSSLDNNFYKVQKEKNLEAANVLAQINIRIHKLIRYLWSKKDQEYKNINKYIHRLRKKYSHRILSENNDKSYTSYSFNKTYLVLCIRHRDKKGGENDFVDINVLMYVVLHELSHLVADQTISESEHDTNEEFKTLFFSFLKAGQESKIYKNINFKNNPEPYCGLTIT